MVELGVDGFKVWAGENGRSVVEHAWERVWGREYGW